MIVCESDMGYLRDRGDALVAGISLGWCRGILFSLRILEYAMLMV